jgi:hypothetical protein
MSRHVAFGLAVFCLAFLSIAYPTRDASAQSAGDIAGVQAASKAFYDALAANDRGKAMANVWAHTPYVTNLGPNSKSIIVGWDANSKYWKKTNDVFASVKAALSGRYMHVNGNLAWEMGLETGEVKMKKDGAVRKIDWFATNVFEKIDGRWPMVSHHVQPRAK